MAAGIKLKDTIGHPSAKEKEELAMGIWRDDGGEGDHTRDDEVKENEQDPAARRISRAFREKKKKKGAHTHIDHATNTTYHVGDALKFHLAYQLTLF